MNSSADQHQLEGRILALDLGQKRVGLALCDELLISITRLNPILRTNWKQLLVDVVHIVHQQNAKALVIGLPLSLDGTSDSAAAAARQTAENFARSLSIPVFLQDERLTSVAAAEQLREAGHNPREVAQLIDSEAAAIILADFLDSKTKTRVSCDLPGDAPSRL
jgi:putative holliday junction resolvase